MSLFKLPFELRYKIYEDVFADNQLTLEATDTASPDLQPYKYRLHTAKTIALLLTCRVCYMEANHLAQHASSMHIPMGHNCSLAAQYIQQSSLHTPHPLIAKRLEAIRRLVTPCYWANMINVLHKSLPALQELQLYSNVTTGTADNSGFNGFAIWPEIEQVNSRSPIPFRCSTWGNYSIMVFISTTDVRVTYKGRHQFTSACTVGDNINVYGMVSSPSHRVEFNLIYEYATRRVLEVERSLEAHEQCEHCGYRPIDELIAWLRENTRTDDKFSDLRVPSKFMFELTSP